MLLKDLLIDIEVCGFLPTHATINISSLAYRPEQIKENCLYICLDGKVCPPLTKDIVAIVAESKACQSFPEDVIVLYVSSARKALSHIYHRFNGSPCKELKIIGVTGTNGKTSTATLLHHILITCGYRTALLGTVSSLIHTNPYIPSAEDQKKRLTTMTTPDPDILYPFLKKAVEAGVTHVVMEVSSHALILEKLSPIMFEEALFTNLSPEHLDFHHSYEDYKNAKRKLFSQCRHATINLDDSFGKELAKTVHVPHTTCGCLWDGEAMASQVKLTQSGISYFYRYGNIKNIVRMSLPGAFQVYNSSLALTSAVHLGIPPWQAVKALSTCKGAKGRLEPINGKGDIQVYIDYAHTEMALKNLLISVKRFAKSRVILVFGCGGDRDRTKRAPMGACAAKYADFTYITSDNSRTEKTEEIIAQIVSGHTLPGAREIIVNRQEAIEKAILNAKPDDTILLVGKGHEEYEIVGDLLFPFDERKIALNALYQRRTHAY